MINNRTPDYDRCITSLSLGVTQSIKVTKFFNRENCILGIFSLAKSHLRKKLLIVRRR